MIRRPPRSTRTAPSFPTRRSSDLVQEHRMIVRAIDRGVSPEQIADALGLEVQTIRKRSRLLDGIGSDAAEMLKDKNCPIVVFDVLRRMRSEEHTSELQSLMRISYAVFCLKKKKKIRTMIQTHH